MKRLLGSNKKNFIERIKGYSSEHLDPMDSAARPRIEYNFLLLIIDLTDLFDSVVHIIYDGLNTAADKKHY